MSNLTEAALSWPTLTQPANSYSATGLRYPRRALRTWDPVKYDRTLSWSGVCDKAAYAIPYALSCLTPYLEVSLINGSTRRTRLASLCGACLVPAGCAVELALSSPRWRLSTQATGANAGTFSAGRVSVRLEECVAGAYVDNVACSIPVLSDNSVEGEFPTTMVNLTAITGYAHFAVESCPGTGPLVVSMNGTPAPYRGTIQRNPVVFPTVTDSVTNDLTNGLTVAAATCGSFPFGDTAPLHYFGTSTPFRVATLSLW